MAKKAVIIDDYSKILDFLSSKSESIVNLMKSDLDWEYKMIMKKISHSDLINPGKRNGLTEGIEKNYLYYLSIEDMKNIEGSRNKEFESAKQSNIFLPADFYKFLEINQLTRRKGPTTEKHNHVIVSDVARVMLVNDTLKYFDIDYTQKVFKKLNKFPTNWKFNDYKLSLSNTDFTEIQLTHAIHGIGTANDQEFKKLRRSIFKEDTFILLLRKKGNSKEIYILLDKNPAFYTLIGEGNKTWESYLKQNNKKEVYELLKKDSLSSGENEKTRKNQNKWRNLLAEEMMNYTPNEHEVFCPLTYITANFDTVGTLFRASHIKEFSNCTIDEAFDINNGILMVSNADALFDKHLITVGEDETIIFSFLIDADFKLKNDLKLSEKVFKLILNDERKKYLDYHREIFYKKELARKKSPDAFEDNRGMELL